MCLAIPGKVIEIKDNIAIVDFGGVKREADISLLNEVKVGDYVIVHVGFAIQKLDQKEAAITLNIWNEILENEEVSKLLE
ncbi:MAG: HypC/HybG/HupF family hydrogenase formation chaperone [Candidatus Hydrothermarchaeota archaeon]|nr:MAG: HypC/HybG/HupF family hydrogenase formation chaperone [Candidatus Hydrothermarchaeota archaeon]